MSRSLEEAPAREPHTPERYLTSGELRDTLSVSDSTLKAWRGRGMPFVGGGTTRPRYRLSEVLAWLGNGDGRR